MSRFSLSAAALALFIASNASADLRTYDVPPQYQQEIFVALREVLNVPSSTGGRVERLPSGQIVVNASPETLEQVEQVLQTIRSRRVEAAPRVELRYWAVLGSRATVASPAGTAPPAALG